MLYLIRKPYYPGENRARLRYFVYFLDFEMYSALRVRPCDSVASCFQQWTEFNVKRSWSTFKILQGSVVTQTMLGGLTIYPGVVNSLHCTCAKNYENWLAVDKVIAKYAGLLFWPTL